MNSLFILNSFILGIGLAMDAFSVSLVNGLREPFMSKKRACAIAGVYAFFQYAMPLTGWICVHTVVRYFHSFEKWVPWIALILLLWIGGKMLMEGVRNRNAETEKTGIGLSALLLQGVADTVGVEADFRCLLRQGLQIVLMAVPYGNDGVSAVQVEILHAFVVPYPAAFAADRDYVEEVIYIKQVHSKKRLL